MVHTHPIYSTAFSSMGEGIPLLLDEAAQVLGAPVQAAKYALPGSPELARSCVEALGDKAMACLLRSHGAVCLGEDLEKAFTVSNVLEATARIYLCIRAMAGATAPSRRTISPPCSTSSAIATASNERKRPRRSAGTFCVF